MTLSIANNVSSINAQNNLQRSTAALNTSLERLSSGFRINRGADGPAALVISEQQRAQIAGLNQAIENTEKAVSLVQTAEGALSEINTLLVRVRGLALDSANAGVNDDNALAANQAEVSNALSTIDRIAANTQFGKKNILDGTAGVNATTDSGDLSAITATSDTTVGTFTVTGVDQAAQKSELDVATALAGLGTPVDPDTVLDNDTNLAQDETLTITNNTTANAETINLTSGQTNVQVRDTINEATSRTGVVASLDANGNLVLTSDEFGEDTNFTVDSSLGAGVAGSTGIGDLEAEGNGENDTSSAEAGTQDGDNIEISLSGPDSQVVSAFEGDGNSVSFTTGIFNGLSFTVGEDAADATLTEDVANQEITVADGTLVFQIGANENQTAELSIGDISSSQLGTGVADNLFASLAELDISTAAGAQDALAVIDDAIDEVTNLRGTLGAFQQNTLESTASNLRITLENTVNAESVIRDTDFAQEIAEFTQQQVLVQAGTSILASANQAPSLVLSLLQ